MTGQVMIGEENGRQPATSNHSKRRGNLQLIAEILENAKVGSTKTNIMCKVGMNYPQLIEYLEILSANSLIESDEGVYWTTSKGLAFIKKFNALNLLFC